jgi:serine protease Do
MSEGLLRLGKVIGIVFVVLGVVGLVATVRGQSRRTAPMDGFRAQVLGGGSSIGADVRDLDSADVSREKLSGTAGAVVDNVSADSPAAKAGLKAGDVITSFDGEKIRSARQFARLVEETAEGRTVAMTVVRAGATVELKVAPEANSGFASMDPFGGQMFMFRDFPNIPGFTTGPRNDRGLTGPVEPPAPRLGVTVAELTEQLGDYFGTRVGVLVVSVADATPAKTAGLKAGDVIVRVNGQVVRSEDDLRRRLAMSTGDVAITIMRDRKEQLISAKIEADKIEPDSPKRIIK